jgi:hypothetical protein
MEASEVFEQAIDISSERAVADGEVTSRSG